MEEQELDFRTILLKLWKYRKPLLIWTLIGAVVGLIIGISIPKEYATTAKIAPESITRTTTGSSVSALASMAGVALRNSSNKDAVYPEMYPDIVNSTEFLTKLFDVPVEFMVKKEVVDTTLYCYILDYQKGPWWGKVLSLPGKGLSAIIKLFRPEPEEEDEDAEVDPAFLTRSQYRVVRSLSRRIQLLVDKKTFVVTVQTTAQSRKVSYEMCAAVLETLRLHVTEYRTEKARHDLEYQQLLEKEARETYYTSQQKYARYSDANQGVVLQRVLIEKQRLQNEMNLNYELYNYTAQQVQVAKAKVEEDTPVFAILTNPTMPMRSSSTSKSTYILACMLIAFCLEALWISKGRAFIASLKKDDSGSDQS